MAKSVTKNIKLVISYDGVNYSGWQSQPGKRTVQGELERAVGELTGFVTKVAGASRTDAGVSALGQVANMVITTPVPVENFIKALNHRLPRDIRILESAEMPMNFDASSDAKSKLYRYKIYTGKNANALQNRNCWHRPGNLDVEAMDKAANILVGTHDFKSFAAAADKRETSVRTVTLCSVKRDERDDKWIYIDIEANRFLYNMVRNIVGTLVEIGRGRWQAEKIKEIMEACDRTAAGPTAPPEGLCLMWIKY
jgi:tRNA pseudouridine38-40 synthase